MPRSRAYLDMITGTLGINAATVRRQGRPCKLCGGFARPFDSVDFYKYCSPTDCFAFGFSGIHVEYRRCQDCGFIFTGFFDDWTPKDFSAYVYNKDYPRVDSEYADIRPANVAALLAERFAPWRDIDMLDYGSGSGAFAKRMAVHGFANITNYDPFSNPVRPDGKFSLITCFEVIEHTVSPAVCINDMAAFLAPGGCIVFSQALQPADIEVVRGSWWYIGPRNGHASIFTADALVRLAADCGLVFHHGDWLHGFASADATETSPGILGTVGAPYASLRLDAPLDDGAPAEQASSWHDLETDGGFRFRWTRESRTTWNGMVPDVYPLRLRIAVPFLNQISEGFAAACTIAVGGHTLATTMRGSQLVAETTLAGPVENVVTLQTPEPATPRALRGATQFTGVEYDPVTAWIARLIHPEARVRCEDYTRSNLAGGFDLVIGNPPFADRIVRADPTTSALGLRLHDYFVARSIARLRPGGIALFVSSTGTMDKVSTTAREHIASLADLMGAVRLPEGVMHATAGTEMVVDALVFQRRAEGQAPSGPAWTNLVEIAVDGADAEAGEEAEGDPSLPDAQSVPADWDNTGRHVRRGIVQINEYFAAHPEMVPTAGFHHRCECEDRNKGGRRLDNPDRARRRRRLARQHAGWRGRSDRPTAVECSQCKIIVRYRRFAGTDCGFGTLPD